MTPADARSELDFFLKIIDGKQFEYPLYDDVEDAKLDGCSAKTITDNIIAFCEGLEKAGYCAGIYCNTYWLNNRIDFKRLERFELWLADWRKSPDTRAVKGMWQYSSTGRINGIVGDVDLDVAYKNYTEIIKSKGLNGFGKSTVKYKITAEKIMSIPQKRASLKPSSGI